LLVVAGRMERVLKLAAMGARLESELIWFGDALLVHGPRDRVRVLQQEPDYIVLQQDETPNVHPGKAGWAVGIMLVALILAAANVLPIAEAVMVGAVAMVLFVVVLVFLPIFWPLR